MAECLFCAIVAGEIPATEVLETDRILAFRDINPQAPTHILVIPKVHYPDVAALAAADVALLGEVIRRRSRSRRPKASPRPATAWSSIPESRRARPSRTSTGTSWRPGPHLASRIGPFHPPRTALIPDNMVLNTLGGQSSGSSRASRLTDIRNDNLSTRSSSDGDGRRKPKANHDLR